MSISSSMGLWNGRAWPPADAISDTRSSLPTSESDARTQKKPSPQRNLTKEFNDLNFPPSSRETGGMR
jgi:hypothetical protein